MKKIFFLLCVSIGLNLYATTVGDLTSAVCKDTTYPCDICSNENSTMAQCKCEAGTSWNSTLKICETAKDACTSPAYWNDEKKTCEAVVTSTYAPQLVKSFAVGSGSCSHGEWSSEYPQAWLTQMQNSGGDGQITYNISKPVIDLFWNDNSLPSASLATGMTYMTPVIVPGSSGAIRVKLPYSGRTGSFRTVGSQIDINNGYVCWYPDGCRCDRTSLWMSMISKCDTGDTEVLPGVCSKRTYITKPSNCLTPNIGVTSAGKCYQPTVCPLGSYTCVSSTTNGGGSIDNTDTTQGATDKNPNGTTNSSGQCSGKIYIFNGKDMRCRPPGMQTGYSDCCTKTDSWFGLTKCGTSEVALGKARVSGNSGDGYCHYVGSYCAEEWNLGLTKICVQKKKTYCCFNGLLGRVIQEQGRPQLGIGWGSSEAPECRGFTPDEFQKLDFSKIDLGEFTQAVTANAAANINKNLGPQINAEIDRFNSTIK